MRALVACEYSGIVREAFAALGHDAMSCDLLPTERPGNHYQGDVIDIIGENWELLIAHPPCTHLSVSGAAWFARKKESGVQEKALDFVRWLMDAPVPRIAIENPVSIISSRIRKPTQVIQPWMFGHPETKATCLWLKGLPRLRPTRNMFSEMMALPRNQRERIHYLSPGPNRWKERSRTFAGIAEAMAQQWGEAEYSWTPSLFELEQSR